MNRHPSAGMALLLQLLLIFSSLIIGANSANALGSFSRDSIDNDSLAVEFYKIPVVATVDAKTYMVGLRDSTDGQAYCAGALIGPRYVLTTMGCAPTEKSGLFNLGWSYKKQYASIGSVYASGTTMGEQIQVTHRFPHPDYSKNTRENDYMVLKLVRKTSYPAVALAPDGTHYFAEGTSASVFGWDSSDASLLNTTMYRSSDICMATVDKLYASQFCALGKQSNDACQFNEGSPIVVKHSNKDVLVGLVNYNPSCGKSDMPTLFARTSKGQTWIKSIIESAQ